jgi:hypothetical protein
MSRLIPLTRGYFAIVDDQDYEELSKHKWHANIKSNNRVYPIRYDAKLKRVAMHKDVLNHFDGSDVDHINGNTLDNRLCNLRICTRSQNTQNANKKSNNTSGYKGVSWHSHTKKWQVQLCANGKYISVGYFDDKIEAAKAYDNAAIKYHGEFSRLNFPK